MRRREFIAGLGAAAWPFEAWSQERALPIIGFLLTGRRDAAGGAFILAAVRRGLAEMGYAEGRNLAIEYRWAEEHLERSPELAADLVRLPVATIVVVSTAAVLAMKWLQHLFPLSFPSAPIRLYLALLPVSTVQMVI
jgi:putative ABC transport system substrate-binding protein